MQLKILDGLTRAKYEILLNPRRLVLGCLLLQQLALPRFNSRVDPRTATLAIALSRTNCTAELDERRNIAALRGFYTFQQMLFKKRLIILQPNCSLGTLGAPEFVELAL